jgi:dipeptidyl aminopeptidase/acylaminoacyl peptidase
MLKRTGLCFFAFLVASFPAAAQVPTIEQSLSLKRAESPRITPDGRHIAYVVREANWKENAFLTQIWVVSAESGTTFQLTRGKKSSRSPQWAPDGKRLAFLSDRDGKNQLYLIPLHGGEALALTRSETGVSGFEWSPDGKHIAFTAADSESKAMKERKEKYGEFVVVEKEYVHTHLWVIDVPDGEADKAADPTRLTEGVEFTVGGFSWSPDSRQIAFAAARDPDLGSTHTSDIYVLSVSDKKVRKLVATQGPDRHPIWSPDGKQIAYETANGKVYFYYTNNRIAVVPAAGGTPAVLTEQFDEHPFLVKWGGDGIYFAAMQRTKSHLLRLDPLDMTIMRVTGANNVPLGGGFSLSEDCRKVASLQGDAEHYPEVCVSGVKKDAIQRLTTLGDQLKGFRLASREVVEWKSKDGTPIEGVLLKPAAFDAKRTYPLLVVIHGGPTGVDTPLRNGDQYYPLEQFAAKGALVLRPNYRGSAGYGEKFRSLNVRNLGVGDYEDVISGVDYLIAKGMVDRDRVGAMGWSQGGYISAFITTFSDRFKAVSVGAGISNWMTYYVNTDIHPFTRQYLKATPWDDPEIYRRTSPISYLKTAKTPTLIQHGELDRRVPIPNAYELYQGLRDRGVPVKLIVFKGFGHGIDKPKQQQALMEQNLEWFGRYIFLENSK